MVLGLAWRDKARLFHEVTMPHHYNCCVPGCKNNFRNAPELQYYRIPKDPNTRKTYSVLLRNKTLKLDSESTRVCSVHYEGGQKLSRTHLPSIFPWTKENEKRRELKRPSYEETLEIVDQCKKRRDTARKSLQPSENNHNDECCHAEINTDQSLPVEAMAQDKDCQTIVTGTVLKIVERDLVEFRELKTQITQLLEENQKLKNENETLRNEINNVKLKLEKSKFDIEKYQNKDEDIAFYTGFPDYQAMQLCYKIVEKSARNISYEHEKVYVDGESPRQKGRPRVLTKFQEFTMTMMRLRLGLFERDLAHRFNVSIQAVSRTTRAWIRFLRLEFEPLITIPPREVIQLYMPGVFKNLLPKLTVIVDCTEIEMEKPSSLDSQSACYSSYKSRNTMKSLLGITPSGVLCFVSEFYPGSTSDKEITVLSGFLNHLKPGDQVMADKGFNCQDELASVGASLITPNFLKGIKQFSKEQTEHNKTVASLRVHVERLMERIKNWHIFDHRSQ